MRILITGKGGKAGSWKVRGEQLGGSIGDVKPNATAKDMANYDAVVVVKRCNQELLNHIRASGKPWVYDVVDCYPQPICTAWDRDYAINWMRKHLKHLKPDGIIYPNRKMKLDVDLPGEVIYHHSRPIELISPLNEKIQTVGYEGADYLGEWLPVIEKECAKRGYEFRNDLPAHRLDLIVAVRGDRFNGYPQRSWKSNIKLANAHGAGVPFIGALENGYIETQTGYEHFVENPSDIGPALDALETLKTRQKIRAAFIRNTITVESCARELKRYVETV